MKIICYSTHLDEVAEKLNELHSNAIDFNSFNKKVKEYFTNGSRRIIVGEKRVFCKKPIICDGIEGFEYLVEYMVYKTGGLEWKCKIKGKVKNYGKYAGVSKTIELIEESEFDSFELDLD